MGSFWRSQRVLHPYASSAWWYGIYVGFNGARYGAAGSTAPVLTASLTSGYVKYRQLRQPVGANRPSGQPAWWYHGASTGARNRQFSGFMTVGGRGSNRSFHGRCFYGCCYFENRTANAIRCRSTWGFAIPSSGYQLQGRQRFPLWQTTDAGFNFAETTALLLRYMLVMMVTLTHMLKFVTPRTPPTRTPHQWTWSVWSPTISRQSISRFDPSCAIITA